VGVAAEAAGQHESALRNYAEAAQIDDHFAELQFRSGRVCLASKQFQKAQEHYRLSRDWDALQFRTDSRLNRIIRDTAGARQSEGIWLVDAEQAFAECPLTEHQIPGSSLFNDHAHMSFDGDYVLARACFLAVASALSHTNASAAPVASLPSRVECAERLGFTSWEEASVAAGMLRSLDKAPFLDQLEHRERLSRAQKALQERFAVLSQKEQLDQARAVYGAAIARDPGDWQLHFTFANFLSQINDPNAAVEQFKMVVNIFPKLQPMRMALANALLTAGRRNEALDQFSEILRFDPECVPAKAGRARIRAGR
jgi:tetratricopeptide (TPR) repeat protein